MTPDAVLAEVPDSMLRREEQPQEQTRNALALAHWLLVQGHRPTLLEIEQERARRANTLH